MSADSPFTINVRVYYEDTDAGGIVYHTNYLKFMERARTEYLRATGYDHQQLLEQQRLLVVSDARIKFRRPAKLDDLLMVTAKVVEVRKVKLTFQQNVYLGNELLCSGEFVVGSIDSETMRPAAITESLRNKITGVIN
ncbi:tol-pal system-associated acyl-CoA thioesterase [Endozoicomonas sp. OPT23]|uniref:tol-pal system-associated acyl-CoA thioesterase n=1 Tax=Endozoicomonas sp. OPT23 TaxID=2072845 RepID=UPI00351BA75B